MEQRSSEVDQRASEINLPEPTSGVDEVDLAAPVDSDPGTGMRESGRRDNAGRDYNA